MSRESNAKNMMGKINFTFISASNNMCILLNLEQSGSGNPFYLRGNAFKNTIRRDQFDQEANVFHHALKHLPSKQGLLLVVADAGAEWEFGESGACKEGIKSILKFQVNSLADSSRVLGTVCTCSPFFPRISSGQIAMELSLSLTAVLESSDFV